MPGSKELLNYYAHNVKEAVYTHCSSHCLNLCLSDASKIPCVRNCLSTISEVCSFFRASAKRTKVLRDALSAAGKDNSTLHSASETRWVERHDAVSVFQESFECIVGALEKVIEWGDEHGSKASSFHACLCKFDFIITLTIMNKMMSLTYIVSKYLQKESIDLSSAAQD
uniref:52 kDa repressor of the inhibitor of the protein kinase-like n=1 Tax=Diabrotica virgifera virgifera TaxID=50390 RepID=A0A6P7FQU3_DIAVI